MPSMAKCVLLVCWLLLRTVAADNNLISNRAWVGLNLGNLKIFPFQGSPYAHSAADIKYLVQEAIKDIARNGGNAVRIWFHIDGSRNPTWSTYHSRQDPGVVTGIDQQAIEDLKRTLEFCYQNNVKVLLSLWSHDILAVRRFNPPSNVNRAIHMITNDDATQAYIDHALLPLVQQLRDQWVDSSRGLHYADMLIGYEIFNEPEGVTWDARLYHDYMYSATWGLYEFQNPDEFDADPERQRDYKSVGFLKKRTYVFDKPSQPKDVSVFQGIIPLGGRSYYDGGDATCPKTCCLPSGTNRNHYQTAAIPAGFYFNYNMFKDVFSVYNSEYDYLVNLMKTCSVNTQSIPMYNVQRFINRVAGAIHRAHPSAQVTVGMHSIPYMTDVQWLKGAINSFEPYPWDRYSIWALQGAFKDDHGGILPTFDPQGYLDFYAPHAYPYWNDDSANGKFMPFYHKKSDWGVDKPVLLGEFWNAKSADSLLTADDFKQALANGYAGLLGWSYYTVKEDAGGSKSARRWIMEHEMRQPLLQLISQLPRN